uniref:Disease resistance R13L4/SHOC-2-like LRR domain-containing protein n=1 Tax=Arundo donax TaxID=35708 RepID=A0A0A8Y0G9_ARUDO
MPKLRTLWLCGSFSKALGVCSLTFLRVLDLYGIKDLKGLPSGIGKMMHLRYLGLQNNGHGSIDIPPSVSDLLNLQTLDARNSRTRSLPQYFWDVPTFRHIHLTDVYCWDAPEVGCLHSLQTLYFSGVCRLEDTKNILITKHRRNARKINIAKRERKLQKMGYHD